MGNRDLFNLFLAASLVTMLGCASVEPVPPLPPEKQADCNVACEHLGKDNLACSWAMPADKCKALCRDLEANGIMFISCSIEAKSCHDADTCGE
jgi:hypothetical protein